MKKILFILLSLFLMTACSNSETPIQKQEVTMSRDEIPQETIDAITAIVLDDVRGVNSSCSECKCTIKSRKETPGGSVTYSFQCTSGNSYWASYCPLDGSVLVTHQYESYGGVGLTPPPPPPCN